MTTRTSLCVLLLVLAASVAMAQPMSGTYTVKKDGSGDFISVYAAGQAITSRGLGGNVVIDIYSGIYDEGYVYLYNVVGDSTYTTTFQPASGQTVTVKATGYSYTFYGYGCYNVKIKNLRIENVNSYGIYAGYYCSNWKVEDCVIRAPNGIQFYYYCDYDSIIGNDIKVSSSYGLYLYNGGYANYHYIANNLISGWTSYGIYQYYSNYSKIVYNTIVGSGSYAIYQYYAYYDTLKNNILQANTYAWYRYYGNPLPDYSNYNCFWNGTAGSSVIYNSSYGAMTLATWQGYGRDGQSIQTNPLTGGSGNPHLRTGSPCINAGNAFSPITDDVDGDSRTSGTPDIGADEYTTVGSPMSGTYYIKKGVTASDTFPSFDGALGQLAVRGQSGDVRFEIFGATYYEMVDLTGMQNGPYWVRFEAHLTSGVPDEVTISSGASYGVVCRGNKRIKFKNLIVTGHTSYGFYLYPITSMPYVPVDTLVVEGCKIYGGSGIYLYCYYGANNDSIIGNDIRATSSYGIYAYGGSSYLNQNVVIANNMISGWSSSGIYSYYGRYYKFIYNTVVGTGSYALYQYYPYNDTLKNNILQANTYGWYRMYGNTLPDYSNYNAFWNGTAGSTVIYNSSYGGMTLAAWQSYGRDGQSIQSDPLTGGPANPHLKTGSPCINAGNAFPPITVDIDGDSRTSGTPDIGADEYTTVGSPMSGTYTIKAAGGGDYRSFIAAFGDVAVRGFGGNVQFDVYDGTYNSMLNFSGIGNGANRLVVREYPGENVTINASGSYGIYLYNNQRIHVEGFNITGYTSYAVYATSMYQNSNTTDSCAVIGCTFTGPNGPMWYYGDDDTLANNIINCTSSYGMYISGYSASPYSQNFVIYNNMVRGWTSYGLYMQYMYGTKLLYNDFVGPTASYGFYNYYNYNTTMRNNIFLAASYAMYYFYGDNYPMSCNNNDYRLQSGGTGIIYHYLYGVHTLSSWQSYSLKDTNGISADPIFKSATDLHLQATSPCINAGSSYSGITTDIDGDSRTANTPDIGADEYFVDVAVRSLLAPTGGIPIGTVVTPSAETKHISGTAGAYYVKMVIDRGGTVVYRDSVSRTTNPGDSAVLTFANWTASPVGSNYHATCYHSALADGVPSNDTARSNFTVGNVDAGVRAIPVPAAILTRGATIAPRALVRNYGDFAATFNVRFTIDNGALGPDGSSIAIPSRSAKSSRSALAVGNTVVGSESETAETDVLVYDTTQSVTLAAGVEETLNFTKTWLANPNGNYTAKAKTTLAGDTDPNNDSLLKAFTVHTMDVGVSRVIAPAGSYILGTPVPPSVKVNNYGTAAAEFEVRVTINDPTDLVVYDTIMHVPSLLPGDSTVVVFSEQFWAATVGYHEVMAWTSYVGDYVPANDTAHGTFDVMPAGGLQGQWLSKARMPMPPSGKEPKDGAWLTFDQSTSLLYAAKGNKVGDFYGYMPDSDKWVPKALIPNGTEGKPPSKGAVGCSDGNGMVYATKGNNTQGFYSYTAALDSWKQLANVPLGLSNKKVKGGTDMQYVMKGDTGFVYLLKGYKNEFMRYNTAKDSWQTLPSAPAVPSPKWDKGSWLAIEADPDAPKLYAHQAKYHSLYAFDVNAGTWGPALKGMPFISRTGKSKKSKDGGAGVSYTGLGKLYAFKGGNTQEYWRYDCAGDSWHELDTLPVMAPGSVKKKKVKNGADLAIQQGTDGYVLYGMKGNKCSELWQYTPFYPSYSAPRPSRDGVAAQNLTSFGYGASISPNPLVAGFASLRYSLPRTGNLNLSIYDVAGRTVMSRTLVTGRSGTALLDLRELSAGVYLAKLSSEGFVTTHKLVVER